MFSIWLSVKCVTAFMISSWAVSDSLRSRSLRFSSVASHKNSCAPVSATSIPLTNWPHHEDTNAVEFWAVPVGYEPDNSRVRGVIPSHVDLVQGEYFHR